MEVQLKSGARDNQKKEFLPDIEDLHIWNLVGGWERENFSR